jgi:hypothetical protein
MGYFRHTCGGWGLAAELENDRKSREQGARIGGQGFSERLIEVGCLMLLEWGTEHVFPLW